MLIVYIGKSWLVDTTMERKLKVLELFSGIGGMHYALEGLIQQIKTIYDNNS